MTTVRSAALFATPLLVCVGCAMAPAEPEVPAALKVPPGQSLYLEALASGVQIYECARKDDASFGWVFKAPEATLQSRSGKPMGKHYAGPTWESIDGSMVVGKVSAKDPGPKPGAVPWLLLAATAHAGAGALTDAKSIQRVATDGGLPPGTPCTDRQLAQVARIPYTATYYFYR